MSGDTHQTDSDLNSSFIYVPPKRRGFAGFKKNHPWVWGLTKWVLIPALLAAAIVFTGGFASIAGMGVLSPLAQWTAFGLFTAAISFLGNSVNHFHTAKSRQMLEHRKRRESQKPSQSDYDNSDNRVNEAFGYDSSTREVETQHHDNRFDLRHSPAQASNDADASHQNDASSAPSLSRRNSYV